MIRKTRNSIGRAALLSAFFIPLAFALPSAAHAQDRGPDRWQDRGQDQRPGSGGGPGGGHGQHQEHGFVRPDSRPDAVDNGVRHESRQDDRRGPELREDNARRLVQDDHRNVPRAPVPPPLQRPESPRYWHGYNQSHYDGRYNDRDRYRQESVYRFRDRDRLLIRDYWAHRPRPHHVVLGGPVISFYIGQLLPTTVYVEPAPVELVEVLQPVPYGYRYIVAGDDILLVDPYGVIVDVVDL